MLLALARCSPADLLNATAPAAGVTVSRNIAYAPGDRHALDIYRPDRGRDLPVIVFFYGGSWRGGSKSIYPFVGRTVARAGAIVVVPDYRVYPEVTFPEFLRDGAQAVAWVQHHVPEAKGGVFLMGHSAGAYNAVMLGLDPIWLSQAGGDPHQIAGVIGLAGPYDFLPITDPEVVPVFLDPRPATQPITFAGAGKPPLLLLTGESDTKVKPRNTRALAARTVAEGGQAETRFYPGIGHIGLILAVAPLFQWRAPVLHDVMTFVHDHAASLAVGSMPKPVPPATNMPHPGPDGGRRMDRTAPG